MTIKKVWSYFLMGLWTLVGAAAFGVITYWVIWHFAEGDMLFAYILNGLTIIAVIIEDKIRLYLFPRRKKKPFKNKILAFYFDYFILEKYNLVSVKSSLYLFYIFALVSSHMLMINPHLEVSEGIRNYFTTVGYGLILLIAVDKFIGQFKKDDRRIKTYEEEHENEEIK